MKRKHEDATSPRLRRCFVTIDDTKIQLDLTYQPGFEEFPTSVFDVDCVVAKWVTGGDEIIFGWKKNVWEHGLEVGTLENVLQGAKGKVADMLYDDALLKISRLHMNALARSVKKMGEGYKLSFGRLSKKSKAKFEADVDETCADGGCDEAKIDAYLRKVYAGWLPMEWGGSKAKQGERAEEGSKIPNRDKAKEKLRWGITDLWDPTKPLNPRQKVTLLLASTGITMFGGQGVWMADPERLYTSDFDLYKDGKKLDDLEDEARGRVEAFLSDFERCRPSASTRLRDRSER